MPRGSGLGAHHRHRHVDRICFDVSATRRWDDVGAVDYSMSERRRRMLLTARLHLISHGVAVAYCLLTLHQPHRPLMLVAYACGMAFGVVGLWAAKTITTKEAGYRISFTILVLTLVVVSLGAYWDGGVSSPSALGFLTTVVFVASYTPHLPLMVGLEALVIGCYLAVAAAGQPTRAGHVFIHVAGMALLVAVCSTQARKLARQRSQLRSLAALDPLTGALNRRGLAEFAAHLPGDGDRVGPSVLCLDLDNFKLVNDRLGHAAGDEILQRTVAAARDALRAGDVIARTGGDEFVVVLVDADAPTAEAIANRISGAVHGQSGVSIGRATAPHDGDTLEALIQAADQRLYRAKEERRRAATSPPRDGDPFVRTGSNALGAP